MKYLHLYLLAFFFAFSHAHAQSGFHFIKGKEKEVLRFKFVNNLMIIPVEVNGVSLSFVLDTGVNKPILFNITASDSLEIKNAKEIYIRGLGDGDPIKALKSKGNHFRIKKNIIHENQDLYVILDEEINFSDRLGFPVHGIIGYDLFKDFIVEINYARKVLKLHDPKQYEYKRCKNCQTFPLEFAANKPYVNVIVDMEHQDSIPVKLLVDSGSSDAIWLFKNKKKRIVLPKKYFEDFLGRGLSGSIYGERSRVKNLHIGNLVLKQAKVSFPDSTSVKYITSMEERNGSLGSEVLRRFHVIFDYRSGKLSLKKNNKFREPFKYNMSGIELQHNGIRFVKELESNIQGLVKDDRSPNGGVKVLLNESYKIKLHPAFEVAEIRKNSPAAIAGIKRGDVILSVNGKLVHRYSLQEVSEMLNEKEGKGIRLHVSREGKDLRFFFTLKKVL